MPAQSDDDEDLYFQGAARPGEQLITYEVPAGEWSGGIRARYVMRVVSGDRAKEIDKRQAEAIMEILQWCRDHPELVEQARKEREKGPQPPPPGPMRYLSGPE